MERFETLHAVAAPMPVPNMDTDQIVPARFLWNARDAGYGKFLFHDLRFAEDGSALPEFVLNAPQYESVRILVAGDNFGCGSSREGAVWALHDHGIGVVIAPSFGDIFFNNAFKNGLLPIVLPAERVQALHRWLAEHPGASMTVDLQAQSIRYGDGECESFEIDPFRKRLLLEGKDEISFTLAQGAAIEAFEARYDREFSWLSQMAR